jgi:hypothetical protein
MSYSRVDNGLSHYWVDEYNMVREGDRTDSDRHVGGDNLWRTGLGYAAWGADELKKGIMDCYEFDSKGKITRIHRSANGVGHEDCSRDQVIMSLAALKVRGDQDEVDKIVKGSKYRISKKFLHTLDSWCWLKDLSGKCWFPLHLLVAILLYAPLSCLSRLNLLGSWGFPSYAQHLTCWTLYTSNSWFGLKWLAQKAMLISLEPCNLLCRYLCGDKSVSDWEINTRIWITDFQWQRWMGNTNHKLDMGKGLQPLTHNQMSQNLLPKDILDIFTDKDESWI